MRNYAHYWRKKRGLTQEQLGEKIGVTKGQISKIENQKQGLNKRWTILLSKALNVEPWQLLKNPEDISEMGQAYKELNNEGLKALNDYIDFLKSKSRFLKSEDK